jgi:hypothetical protein
VKRFRDSLSAFFAWTVRERMIAVNPVTSTRVPKASAPRTEMCMSARLTSRSVTAPTRPRLAAAGAIRRPRSRSMKPGRPTTRTPRPRANVGRSTGAVSSLRKAGFTNRYDRSRCRSAGTLRPWVVASTSAMSSGSSSAGAMSRTWASRTMFGSTCRFARPDSIFSIQLRVLPTNSAKASWEMPRRRR